MMVKKRKPWRRNWFFSILWGINSFLRWVLLIATGWVVYSNLYIKHKVALSPAVPADRKEFESKPAGKVSYYLDRTGRGRPLVLLHSVNAAASAYEMRPLFLHYQGHRPVYALDLPGYGFSDRSNRAYSPQVFADVIREFLATQVKKPADVVALSLSCEFAAIAAMAEPGLFHSLVFISPSGMGRRGRTSNRPTSRGLDSERLYGLLSAPFWGRPLYDLIVTRPSIRYFLSRSFVGLVPYDFIEYDLATSHQPGAEIVPLNFISGRLFTPDILTSCYERLEIPTCVIYDRDFFVRFDWLQSLLEKNQNWRAVRITPSLGLPQFERLDQTVAALEEFFGKV
jgi:pimeloyl-ACP methyl ester carboxylesterase